MINHFYKENYSEVSLVETVEHGIIDLRRLPITVSQKTCHVIEWAVSPQGWREIKHILSESSGCSLATHGGAPIAVIRIIK